MFYIKNTFWYFVWNSFLKLSSVHVTKLIKTEFVFIIARFFIENRNRKAKSKVTGKLRTKKDVILFQFCIK